MRVINVLAILISAIVPMASSAFSVKGVVVDSTGQPEGYATVRVYAGSDSVKPVAMGITDDAGAFAHELNRAGNYSVKISSVGKQTLDVPFDVNASRADIDLGTLTMRDNSALLGEVEVVATKPLVSKEIDRIGYDVQADEDSKTSNVQDILRKVPMVTVDSDGTIKVKGSSNFKIYKDGRPSNSFTSNAKDIFAAIPASMIEKIEVITDPGAKEDAEGVGAILNIVTVKHASLNGLMGNVRAGMMTHNATPVGGVWLSGNVGKVVLSANAGYFHQSESMSKSESESEYTYADTGNRQIQSSRSRSHGDFVFYGIDGSYELDSLNLFTLEFGGHWYDFKSQSSSTTSMFSSLGNPIYSYGTDIQTPKNRGLEFNGNFNYQHSTQRKGETFTLSYQISNSNNDDDSQSVFTEILNYPAPFTSLNTVNDLHFIENTLQADWTRPVDAHNTYSVGLKWVNRSNHSETNNYYSGIDNTYSNFTHRTMIGAAYVDWRYTLKKLSARAGLRYEYSRLSQKYRDASADDFGSSLNDWVPNASVMYSLNDQSSIKLAYSSRINRPGINFLNPAVIRTPDSESYGNPDLSSVHYNSLSINYSLFTRKFNFDVNASYDFSNNSIAGVTVVDPVTDFITSTYDNIGQTRSFNLSLFGQWTITQKTSVMLNAQVNYKHLKYQSMNLSNYRWSTNMFFRATQQLPWKLRLEGMLYYGSGDLTDIYSYSHNDAHGIFHGFSLQRSFLKADALTVKLHARNPFNSKMVMHQVRDRGGYVGESVTTMPSMRLFGIELSYRFGSMRASVKKTAATINNDDMQGGASAPSTGSQGGMSM